MDGSLGSFQSAATVSLPAEGGRVEAFISGHDLQIDAADADQVQWPCMAAAKAIASPGTPADLSCGLTATLPA